MAKALKGRAAHRADERLRIARDLHDTLLQGVQGLILQFHVAAQDVPPERPARARLDEALEAADRVLDEARNRVSRLRSADSDNIDLVDGFEKIAADLNVGTTVAFALTLEGKPVDLRVSVREEVYHVGRVALTHAFRHAKARNIQVNIAYTRAALTLTVCDDGRGFDAAATGTQVNDHGGLVGIHKRARRVGARFECHSTGQQGTRMVMTTPACRAYASESFFSRVWAKTQG